MGRYSHSVKSQATNFDWKYNHCHLENSFDVFLEGFFAWVG